MSICGPQYKNSNCQCYLQLTPGLKPGSNVATSTPICAFRLDDFQYACDSGCCPAACTIDNAISTTAMETKSTTAVSISWTVLDWFLIVMAIVFCILLFIGIAWASRRRKNLGT